MGALVNLILQGLRGIVLEMLAGGSNVEAVDAAIWNKITSTGFVEKLTSIEFDVLRREVLHFVQAIATKAGYMLIGLLT